MKNLERIGPIGYDRKLLQSKHEVNNSNLATLDHKNTLKTEYAANNMIYNMDLTQNNASCIRFIEENESGKLTINPEVFEVYILMQILSKYEGENISFISVVGERYIGKSFLLNSIIGAQEYNGVYFFLFSSQFSMIIEAELKEFGFGILHCTQIISTLIYFSLTLRV